MTRDHGSRARYVGGPDENDQPGRGCRCASCTEANRLDHQHRARMRLYGQWQPYVDAAPAREHARALSAAGIGRRRVADLAGISGGAVSRLLFGGPGDRPPTRRIRPETEARILGVKVAPAALSPGATVDATGTRRRLQALVACGYSKERLAARLGVTGGNLATSMEREQVIAATERAVRALYDELWDVPPDASGHREKISPTRARNYARDRDWPLPLAWDDDMIDDPAAKPAEGWRRSERTTFRSADLVEDAEFVREAGDYRTPNEIAVRLGVSRDRLDHAYIRAARQAGAEREAG